MLDFLSDQVVIGGVRHLFGQRQFAVINVLPDQVRVVGCGPQLQIFFKMIDRPRPIRGQVLVVNQTQFQVRRGGTRVDFEGLLECADGAGVVLGGLSASAGQIIRVFLLVRATLSPGGTAAAPEAQPNRKGQTPRQNQPTHAPNLNELRAWRNGGLARRNPDSTKKCAHARRLPGLYLTDSAGSRGAGWPAGRLLAPAETTAN